MEWPILETRLLYLFWALAQAHRRTKPSSEHARGGTGWAIKLNCWSLGLNHSCSQCHWSTKSQEFTGTFLRCLAHGILRLDTGPNVLLKNQPLGEAERRTPSEEPVRNKTGASPTVVHVYLLTMLTPPYIHVHCARALRDGDGAKLSARDDGRRAGGHSSQATVDEYSSITLCSVPEAFSLDKPYTQHNNRLQKNYRLRLIHDFIEQRLYPKRKQHNMSPSTWGGGQVAT